MVRACVGWNSLPGMLGYCLNPLLKVARGGKKKRHRIISLVLFISLPISPSKVAVRVRGFRASLRMHAGRTRQMFG